MNVVDLPTSDLSNIAARLREMADWIEKSDERWSVIMILGCAGTEPKVYGWGYRVSGLETQGWIARAASHVAKCVESFYEEAG